MVWQGYGFSLAENVLVQVEQDAGEVVDWSDGTESHGGVLSPQQVGAEHHGQVCVGHLVHLAFSRHLNRKKQERIRRIKMYQEQQIHISAKLSSAMRVAQKSTCTGAPEQ